MSLKSKSAQNENRSHPKKIFYWITTLIVCVVLLFGTLSNLNIVQKGYAYGVLDRLGYPRYLAVILSACKLAASVILLSPRFLLLKEWAYAGVVILFSAAFVSHVIMGDDVLISGIPLMFCLVTLFSYWLRPDNRRAPM